MHGQLEMSYGVSAKAISDVQWVNPNNEMHHGRKKTSFRLSILPRWCHSSKKSIWFKMGYRVRHIYYGYNGETTHEDRWYSKIEYLKLRIMG